MPRHPIFRYLRLGFLALALSILLPATTSAQNFPNRPVKLIVPYSAAGPTDIFARVLADAMSKKLGQAVIVENRSGASGVIGMTAVAKSPADGYTLGLATISTHGTVPAVTAKLPYDPIADFTPLTNAVMVPSVMVINGKLGPKNMKEFIALLKSSPGKYSFGSSGIGSGAHLDGELFKQVTGTFMVHIPYRGSSAATNDLLAGEITAQYDALSSTLPYIKSGKLIALAIASNSRIPELPDVPTYTELGLKELNNPAWWGIVGPAKMPSDIADKLNALIADSLHEPEVEAQLRRIGASVQTESRQSFSARIQRELALRKEIATKRKIVVD